MPLEIFALLICRLLRASDGVLLRRLFSSQVRRGAHALATGGDLWKEDQDRPTKWLVVSPLATQNGIPHKR
jgi:hypothetical protein